MKASTLSLMGLVFCQFSWSSPGSLDQAQKIFTLIKKLDSVIQPKDPKISRCAAFSYLFEKLYQEHGGDARSTLSSASLYLGDSTIIYGKMVEGSNRLKSVGLAPMSDAITRTLLLEWNSRLAPGHEWSKEKFSSNFKLDEDGQTILKSKQLVHQVLNNKPLPAWLSDHGAMEDNQGVQNVHQNLDGHQSLKFGYRQNKGDTDATGRHDHLLGNMLLGYSSEKLADSSELMSGSHMQLSCDQPTATVPLQTLSLAYLASSYVYRSVATLAPLADEYLDFNQNGSSTDLRVNKSGIKLGRWLAQLEKNNQNARAGELNARVFEAICDESQMRHLTHYGPLDDRTLEDLLK